MEAIRYALAHVISQSKMDMTLLDEQTLMDVFAILPEPSISFAAWLEKVTPKKTKEQANEDALRNLELMQNG